jgi:hypothetical protein
MRSFRHGWSLAALTGGDSVNIFGEWDGFEFEPITVHCGAMLYSLEQIDAMNVLAKAV